jgi:hypothetical protein
LEYLHVPAHFHFGWATNSTDSAGLYAQLLVEQNIFAEDKCVPGFDEIPCDTPNGQGVQACVNNKLVPGQCTVVSCNAGYYLNQSSYGSAGLLQASCQPCGVGTWRSNATWTIKTVRGVVQDRSYEAQSVCAPCKLVANVTLADGTVTCSGKFTATAVQSDNCPWVYRCEAALDGSKVDKKSLHVALGVLIPLVILFFALAIYFWKAASTAKGASEQINRSTGYHAMP